MTRPGPRLDGRDAAALRGELDSRLPGYIGGWAPEPGSVGAALLDVTAQFAATLVTGLDALPERSQLTFLDRLGVGLLPAQPARAPLVFTLLPDSPLDVPLPAGTQVAAPPPAQPPAGTVDPEPVLFATDERVMLGRARLTSVISVDPGTDTWTDHTDATAGATPLFPGSDPVEHALYIGHDAILALAGNADVTLSIDLAAEPEPAGRRDLTFAWHYLSTDGWMPLEVVEDRTARLTRSGLIRLRKSGGPDSAHRDIGGHSSHWIRGMVSRDPIACTVLTVTDNGRGVVVDGPGHLRTGDAVTVDGVDRAVVTRVAGNALALSRTPTGLVRGALMRQSEPPDGLTPPAAGAPERLPRIDTVRVAVNFTKADLPAEAVIADGLPVDPNSTLGPFGPRPAPFATFAVASQDVFSRRGAEIGLRLEFRRPGTPHDVTLSFEYFDGVNWRLLTGEHELRDGTDSFARDGEVVFRCPSDWSAGALAGQRNHWLRIRLDAGDYGLPERLTIDPQDPTKVVFTPATLDPPVIGRLSLRYRFHTVSVPLDHCLTYNDFHFTDRTTAARLGREPFPPFSPVGDATAAVHLGFDRPPPAGLFSLYADAAADARTADASAPEYVWEYRSPRGWTALGVLDGTHGFRRGGLIQFVWPPDAIAADGHNGNLYRLRGRLRPGTRVTATRLGAVWTNAVWATQRQIFTREIVGMSDGSSRQSMTVPRNRVPILAGERVEVREWAGRGETWRTAVQGLPAEDLQIDPDPVTGAPRAVWVRYAERPHLYFSGPGDRHVLVERATGLIRFGDGRRGRIPPAGSPVRATYSSGGGAVGNLPAGVITELRAAVPYVIGVTNVAPATGGAAVEGLDRVRARGAQRLRHRARAVAPADVAWLVRDMSPAVARARCLLLAGPDGPGQRGWVTVLIVPDGDQDTPQPSVELLRRVREQLAAAVPAPLMGRVRVLGPVYATVSVAVAVVPTDPTAAAAVEAAVSQRLREFLHPVHGGPYGDGWDFGQPVYQSQIAGIVERSPGVEHAVRVQLRTDELVGEAAGIAPYAVVASGDHEVTVTVGGER